MRSKFLRLVLFLALGFAAACSSSGADDGNSADGESSDASLEQSEIALPTESDVPNVPGAPLNPFDLRAGECFNQGSWYDEELERRIDLTAMVDCSEDHQREVYHEAEFPAPGGAPFPGEAKMTEWSTQVCYDAFADFVNSEYELSTFEIGFLQPTQATFEHEVGLHRRVTCYLFDPGEDTTAGSARNTGL